MKITANNKFGSCFESFVKPFSRCKTVSCPKIASIFTQWKTARPRLETGSASKPIDPKTASLLQSKHSSYLTKTAALLALTSLSVLVWSLKPFTLSSFASTIGTQNNLLQNTSSSAIWDRSLALNSCPAPNSDTHLNADSVSVASCPAALSRNDSSRHGTHRVENLGSEPLADQRIADFPLDLTFMQQEDSDKFYFNSRMLLYHCVKPLIIKAAPLFNQYLKSEAIDDYVADLRDLIPREKAKIRSQKEWEQFARIAEAQYYASGWLPLTIYYMTSVPSHRKTFCMQITLFLWTAGFSIFSLYRMLHPIELNVYFTKKSGLAPD